MSLMLRIVVFILESGSRFEAICFHVVVAILSLHRHGPWPMALAVISGQRVVHEQGLSSVTFNRTFLSKDNLYEFIFHPDEPVESAVLPRQRILFEMVVDICPRAQTSWSCSTRSFESVGCAVDCRHVN